MTGTVESCTCDTCQSACVHKPGWFKPGEAERTAEYLGMSLAELFRTKLAVDWWEADYEFDTDVFVIAPAIVGEATGQEYPGNPRGRCVFYVEGRCQIHAVKPFECQSSLHNQGEEVTSERHKEVTQAWVEHQDQPVELLGREPKATEYNGGWGGMFGSLFSYSAWEDNDDDNE